MFHSLVVRGLQTFLAAVTITACHPDVGLAANRARAYLLEAQPDLAAIEVHVTRIGEANPELAATEQYRALVEAIRNAKDALAHLEAATAPDQPRDIERIAQATLAVASAWKVVERAKGLFDTISEVNKR